MYYHVPKQKISNMSVIYKLNHIWKKSYIFNQSNDELSSLELSASSLDDRTLLSSSAFSVVSMSPISGIRLSGI